MASSSAALTAHAPSADLRKIAFDLIRARSFGRRKIVLASGRESDFYFDMKPTMLHPAGAHALSELMVDRLAGHRLDFVGGLELGAVPLVSLVNVTSQTRGAPIAGFLVRKAVKGHGTKKRIEGVAEEDLRGRRVAILDDVTTSGGSAMQAVEIAKEAGADVALVLSIVDRGEGATEFYREANVPFEALFTAREFLEA